MGGGEGASSSSDLQQWRIRPGPYLGEISALSILPLPPRFSSLPLLLAGTGSELLAYDVGSGRLIESFRVFQGIRVHGIALRSPDPDYPRDPSPLLEFLIAVFGERRVKLFRMRVDDGLGVGMEMLCRLPGFDHWVLDACFLKDDGYLAIGLSDNSVAMWDICRSNLVVRVKSPDRCLLYSMRMWGDNMEELRVASGTIYNEIIVWKLGLKALPAIPTVLMEESFDQSTTCENMKFHTKHYTSIHLCRLSGHEGSIFRMTWSSDGSTLMSASDDRSARIWKISDQWLDCGNLAQGGAHHDSINLILFGHDARVWDCCISDSIVITAGEDCTCRVWGKDGSELLTIKEHAGRGIWRCLYDPGSSLLITAGFDSAIKVHQLRPIKETSKRHQVLSELHDQAENFTLCAPKVSKQHGLMDSKSEYVRCMHFTQENILYVATNNGFLYHVELSNPGNVRWTKLTQISEEAPIVCMDLMDTKGLELSSDEEDMIAVGDGKGNASVVRFISKPTPKLATCFTWSAEKERQLLGIYWCKSLGCSHLFTADPRGVLKMWKISDALRSDVDNKSSEKMASLIAIFTSNFGTRIMCLDVSIQLEVVICGDQRGNLTVFPLSEGLIIDSSGETVEQSASISCFKGAHGISCVTSALIATLEFNQVEVRTTGGDGCICYFKYDRSLRSLEFSGMKQVKELSIVQSVASSSTSAQDLAGSNYAIGFTSTDFIIWDLINEVKAQQISCGGWRRSYTYHLGPVPVYQNCFAYLKDHTIHVYRRWTPIHERQLFPQVLHMQYHGREIHSLCFVPFMVSNLSCKLWIATGCEDGSVRLTRYDIGSWGASKLLGEHVGGSAVRSTCFMSRISLFGPGQSCNIQEVIADHDLPWSREDPLLLISVGAKQVLTCWLLVYEMPQDEASGPNETTESANILSPSTNEFSKITFQWLSTHMPAKFTSTHHRVEKLVEITKEGNINGHRRGEPNENDWRYLAVTAFVVKHTESRLTVSFVVVACSDASLVLRALVLPNRRWYDVALLIPQTSPVLALQHVVLPCSATSDDTAALLGNAYVLISGSTDGSITFWDLTETVDYFMKSIIELEPESPVDSLRRPQTGRGSQGGRWWRSLIRRPSGERAIDALVRNKDGENVSGPTTERIALGASCRKSDLPNGQMSYPKTMISATLWSPGCHTDTMPSEILEIWPLYVIESVHQSGVNCLHVSKLKDCLDSINEAAYCVVSGGDDQALHSLGFSLELQIRKPECTQLSGCVWKSSHCRLNNKLRVLFQDRIASAHNSAVKGIWTDGCWAFSTGLDQRVRCWQIERSGKLIEHANLVISVPEPEALDAMICGSARNRYQIAVAGRGMQMVEFSAPCDED